MQASKQDSRLVWGSPQLKDECNVNYQWAKKVQVTYRRVQHTTTVEPWIMKGVALIISELKRVLVMVHHNTIGV